MVSTAVELDRIDVAVARAEGCEAGIDADFGRGLVNPEAQAGDLDGRVGDWEEVCEGDFGRRYGGPLWVAISFCLGTAPVWGLILGREKLVVRMNVSGHF